MTIAWLLSGSKEKLSHPSRANHVLNAEIRVENPLPDETSDDEGQGKGIEHDGPERVFEPDLLIKEGGENEPDDKREDQRTQAEDDQVLDRDHPFGARPEAFVLIKTDKVRPGQQPGLGEREDNRPDRSSHEDHQRSQNHGNGGDLGCLVAKEAYRALRGRSCAGGGHRRSPGD
jgi:hypothetical protein